ncbi:EamA family transporter RarD [Dermacoccus abyssi]|uniref:EamA family transporter RarD n=1 Tax=Dermacoccus abyssi TaxID=322596 RepID=UPI00389963A9
MFPLYFHALIPAGPWEILAHRILWTLLLCVVLLGVTRHLGFLRSLFGDLKRLGAISIAAVLIAINWVVYVLAVTTGHVTEAALGYFLNPLVTVMLGVLVLGEKLRRMQWLAVAIGVIACVYLAVDYGSPPWISVGLALSFAAYGLMKKRVGGRFTALEGLTAETVVLAPFAAVMLVWLGATGRSTWSGNGSWHPVLLALSGVATAIPLLLFAAAARRIPLSTIGLLQFMTPVMQLLCGVLVLGETMSAGRWVGFGLVWIALVVLTADSLAQARRTRRARRATPLETSAAAPT